MGNNLSAAAFPGDFFGEIQLLGGFSRGMARSLINYAFLKTVRI